MDFIRILSDVLAVLPSARSTAASYTGKNQAFILEKIVEAEQSALVALEIIAQIDVLVDFGCRSNGANAFLEIVSRRLLPVVSSLSVHLDGDVRVVVSASLRRMIPTVLKGLGRDEVDLCLGVFLSHIPVLMADLAPIPQYTLRLLCDAIRTSVYASQLITSRLISNGGLGILVSALGGSKSKGDRDRGDRDKDDRSVDDDHIVDCDPQLPILLRILYEKAQIEEQEEVANLKKNPLQNNNNSNQVMLDKKITYVMLELGISHSLSVAIQSCVGDSSSSGASGTSSGASGVSGVTMQTELVSSLVELLYRVLLFVILALSQSAQSPPAQANSQVEADQLRKYVTPLRDLLPSLFAILGGAVAPYGTQDVSWEIVAISCDIMKYLFCISSIDFSFRESMVYEGILIIFLSLALYASLLIYLHLNFLLFLNYLPDRTTEERRGRFAEHSSGRFLSNVADHCRVRTNCIRIDLHFINISFSFNLLFLML